MHVVRWGQSAYETDEDLAREAAAAERLGATWRAVPDVQEVPHDLAQTDVLVVTSKVRVTAAHMADMAGRCVLTTTSGVDHLDLQAAAEHGVVVGRCPLARRDAVVEHALAGLTWGLRRLGALDEASRSDRWARGALPALAPRSVLDATVVVVGLGVIGRKMVEVLTALGTDVRGVDPYAEHPSAAWTLDEALRGADAVTLHCALTPTSRDLLTDARMALLPTHGVVVNTARGDSLDVAAAVSRVKRGELGGVVVDVFPVEPYPQIAEGGHPRVLFTPHSAGFVHDLGARVASEVSASLEAWAAGKPLPHRVAASERA